MNLFEFILALMGIGFVVTVVVAVLAFFGIRKLVRWVRSGSSSQAAQFQPLDQESATAADVRTALKRHTTDYAVGKRACSAMNQASSAEEKQAHLKSLLAGKFTEESLTYSKFMAAVDTASHALMRNCALLANRVLAFDTRDYRNLERARSASAIRASNSPTDMQMQRWNVMSANLREMDAIIATNESLLLELDKLSIATSRVGQDEADAATNEMLDEIQQLSDQARLYS